MRRTCLPAFLLFAALAGALFLAPSGPPAIAQVPLQPVLRLPLILHEATVPAPAPPITGVVTFTVGSVTIPTYPYTAFLRRTVDPALYDYPLRTLDRNAYNNANPQPTPVSYTLLSLENAYLRLTLLPELGGRIYEVIYKPAGHNELYRNPVIKPTEWGPGPSGGYPDGANWWLAAGGIEWGFPVEEHGYEWATAWEYTAGPQPDGSYAVTMTLPAEGRPAGVSVTVSLAPESAGFEVQPRIVNLLDETFRFKWWANAMLAPGGDNRAGADLHFLFPVSQVTVHSTGDDRLPRPGEALSWPIYDGRDLSRLGNWRQWLGFFERPAAQGNWTGVYDTAIKEGLVRIYPAAVVRGAKGFGMGYGPDAIPPSLWTDDGSSYVEMHGGLAPTFDDWYELPARGEVTWRETWFPAAGVGQIAGANARGAVSVARTETALLIGLYLPTPAHNATLTVTAGEMRFVTPHLDLGPAQPFEERLTFAPGAIQPATPITVVVQDRVGADIYRYEG